MMSPAELHARMKQQAAELVATMQRANDAGVLNAQQWRALGTVKQLAGVPTNTDLRRLR